MMKAQILILLLLFTTSLKAAVSIIPIPQKCVERKGNFIVNEKTTIVIPENDKDIRDAISVWNDLFTTAAGFPLEITTLKQKTNFIQCSLNASLEEEAYKLKVSTKDIRIEAKTAKGIFYAFQTLRQLLPPAIEGNARVENIEWNIPCVTIEDKPSFSYRGMMLDVSRHFIRKRGYKALYRLACFSQNECFSLAFD